VQNTPSVDLVQDLSQVGVVLRLLGPALAQPIKDFSRRASHLFQAQRLALSRGATARRDNTIPRWGCSALGSRIPCHHARSNRVPPTFSFSRARFAVGVRLVMTLLLAGSQAGAYGL
jgi:hypothetical protein